MNTVLYFQYAFVVDIFPLEFSIILGFQDKSKKKSVF